MFWTNIPVKKSIWWNIPIQLHTVHVDNIVVFLISLCSLIWQNSELFTIDNTFGVFKKRIKTWNKTWMQLKEIQIN